MEKIPLAVVTPATAGHAHRQELPLTRVRPGQCCIVTEVLADDDDIKRLMAMGVCAGRKIELVKDGNPMIFRVLGSRLGISERLGRQVMVDLCLPSPEAVENGRPACAPSASAAESLTRPDSPGATRNPSAR